MIEKEIQLWKHCCCLSDRRRSDVLAVALLCVTLALEDSGEDDAAAFAQPWKRNSAAALEIISVVPDLDSAQNQHSADADSTTVRVPPDQHCFCICWAASWAGTDQAGSLCSFFMWTCAAAGASALTPLKPLSCWNREIKCHFNFRNLSLLPADPQSYCHSVCEGQMFCTHIYYVSAFLFFFLSRTKQGQPVLLSVFTEGLMTHVQATIPPPPLRSTVACTFNNECHGDRRQQRAGVQVQGSNTETNTRVSGRGDKITRLKCLLLLDVMWFKSHVQNLIFCWF